MTSYSPYILKAKKTMESAFSAAKNCGKESLYGKILHQECVDPDPKNFVSKEHFIENIANIFTWISIFSDFFYPAIGYYTALRNQSCVQRLVWVKIWIVNQVGR